MINLYSHLLYVIDLKAYSLTDSLYLQDMIAKKNRSFFDRGKVEAEGGEGTIFRIFRQSTWRRVLFLRDYLHFFSKENTKRHYAPSPQLRSLNFTQYPVEKHVEIP